MPGGRCFSVKSPLQLIEENVFLFCSEIAICAADESMGVLRRLQLESVTESTVAEGLSETLVRLDSYLARNVTCFSDDGTEKADIHRQKSYHDTFASFLTETYNDLIGCIKMFAEV